MLLHHIGGGADGGEGGGGGEVGGPGGLGGWGGLGGGAGTITSTIVLLETAWMGWARTVDACDASMALRAATDASAVICELLPTNSMLAVAVTLPALSLTDTCEAGTPVTFARASMYPVMFTSAMSPAMVVSYSTW